MPNFNLKTIFPLIAAIILGIVGVIYYLNTGFGSKVGNVQKLQKENTVKEVKQNQNQTVTIQCKNGEKYEIVYRPDQTNYQDLVYNKCGQ